jgi:hypothetical protein
MSFLANPIGNISGGIHDLGKSSLGRMAETAALVYFMGPAGLNLTAAGGALAGMGTAGLAGLAGGATSLLNGGSIMDAVKSGAMAYGAGSLMGGESGIDAENGPAARGGAPVVDKSTLGELAKAEAANASVLPQNVAQYGVNNFGQIPSAGLNPSFAGPDYTSVMPTTTPLQAPVAPVDQFAAQNNSLINGTYGQTPALSGVNTGYGFDNNPTGVIGTNTYQEGLAAGKGALGSSSTPSTGFFSGLKDKFMALPGYQQAGIGAAGLLALKGMAKNNTVAKAPDNRRLKFYGGNPYSGAGAMYETPTLAASGGIVALANGGDVKKYPDGGPVFVSAGGNEGEGVYMTPSQMASYSGDSVYAPAIAALTANAPASTAPVVAAPTVTAPATQSAEVTAAINAGRKGIPGATAQDFVTGYSLNQDQAAQVAQALGYTGDLKGLNYSAAASAAPTTTTTNPSSLLGLAALDKSITGSATATPAQAGQVAMDRTYLNSIMNPTAGDLASLNGATAADKAALINKAINAANDVYGGNNAASQKVIAQLMDVWKINPDTVQSSLGSSYTGPSVQSLYSAVDPTLASGATPAWANQGAYATPAAAMAAATAVDNKTPVVDPNAVAASLGLKGTYKSLSDVATALGLPPGNYASMADITKAITALSVTPKTPITPAPLTPTAPPVNLAPVVNLAPTTMTAPSLDKNGYYVPATGPTATSNSQTYNAGYISNTANPTTAQGVGGSHAFVDPNGYISQAPAMPFRPIGGYGTLQAAKDAYTKAGGSLGYTNPKAPAVTTEDATQHYLDILSGKAPASKVPYTPNGVIAAPYYSSVMGMPLNPKYEVSQANNPHYDPKFSPSADYIGAYAPGYTGEAAPALDPKTIAYLQGQGANVGTNPTAASASSSALTSTSGAPVTLPNKVTATPLTNYPGYLKGTDGKYYDKAGNKVADTEEQVLALINEVPAANGGLMGLAAGGLGNLGGYSDGGRLLRGPGDGISDSIPASIGGRQPARLADGEFVVPARIVSEIGNGSTEAGARKLYQMMDRVQNARKKTTGKQQVAANPRAEQYLPA